MKLIDKMLFLIESRSERLVMAFIDLDESSGLYIVTCCLWDGVTGSGEQRITTEHATEQEAREAIERIANQYPNRKRIPVFINDLELDGKILLEGDDDA